MKIKTNGDGHSTELHEEHLPHRDTEPASTEKPRRRHLAAALFFVVVVAAGVAGTLLSHLLSYQFSRAGSVPTGPTVVLCATALVLERVAYRPLRGAGDAAEPEE